MICKKKFFVSFGFQKIPKIHFLCVCTETSTDQTYRNFLYHKQASQQPDSHCHNFIHEANPLLAPLPLPPAKNEIVLQANKRSIALESGSTEAALRPSKETEGDSELAPNKYFSPRNQKLRKYIAQLGTVYNKQKV